MLIESDRLIAGPPELIEFDTSNVCNLKCRTCRRNRPDYTQANPQYLSFHTYRTIIDKVPKLKRVQFCGSSEPTLNEDLTQMINYAKKSGAEAVEMFTNATILCGERAKNIIGSQLDILKVSIDGADRETYRKARGAELATVVANIRDFHRQRPDVPIGIEFVLSTITVNSVDKLPDLARTIGAGQVEIRLTNWADPNLNQDAIYGIERLRQIKTALEAKCNQMGIKVVMTLPDEPGFMDCTTLSELYVTSRGEVTPCYFMDRTIIGTLADETSFEQVWNGPRMRDYRRKFLNGIANPDCCCSWALVLNKKV